MKFKLLMFLTITFLFIGDIDTNNSIVYMSLVDRYNGFGKIMNTSGEPPLYENRTLNINVGDSVTWVNNDPSDKITIISEQGLWNDNGVILVHTGRRSSYTFNETGKYTFHIAEYNMSKRQTIIVSNIGDNVDTVTEKTINVTKEKTINVTKDKTTDTIAGNTTNTVTENATNMVTENTTASNVNDTYIYARTILVPLNIFGNLKMMGIITFVIVVIISLIKD